MLKSDLIKLLEAYPNVHVKIVESKKHDDDAPTMDIVDTGLVTLEQSEDEVILLWMEPNPETVTNKKES